MSEVHALRGNAAHVARFLGYVLRRFWLARATVLLALLVLTLEYALLSVMIPLAGGEGQGWITQFWSAAAKACNFPVGQPTWLWFFLALTAASVIVSYVHFVASAWLARSAHRALSERIFRRVLFDEPMIDIYRRSIGYYITLAGDDTFRAGTIVNTAATTFSSALSALAGFVLLYVFSAKIFVGAAVFLAVSAAFVGSGFRQVLRRNASSVELSRELGTAYVESLNGLRSIRSMSAERFVHQGYVAGMGRYVRLLFQIDSARQAMKLIPSLLILAVAAVALWPRGASAVTISVSYLLALTTILVRIFLSLGQVVQSGSTLLLDVRAAKDIEDLVGTAPNGAPVEAPYASPVRLIELRGVRFRYPGGPAVLDGFNHRFEAGRTYAIVGRSGSGKSTLADLLLGLVEPQAGELVVNGQRQTASSLRRHVILVEQQARIFTATVRENLLLGIEASDDALWEALRTVDLEAYVRALPGGLDSVFQYQGANLSGGQRQRLGIARALLRQPDALILDEATSALDTETRRTLVDNLRRGFRDRLLVFITHEQAIADDADEQIRLDGSGPLPMSTHA